MARRYYSDKSGARIPERDATVLKINRGSPLFHPFGGELHLDEAEAQELAAWLGRPIGGPGPDQADNGVDGPRPPAKPRGPRKAG